MLGWLRQLDDLLRGRKTSPERLLEGRVELPLGMFIPLAVVLGLAYGFLVHPAEAYKGWARRGHAGLI